MIDKFDNILAVDSAELPFGPWRRVARKARQRKRYPRGIMTLVI